MVVEQEGKVVKGEKRTKVEVDVKDQGGWISWGGGGEETVAVVGGADD